MATLRRRLPNRRTSTGTSTADRAEDRPRHALEPEGVAMSRTTWRDVLPIHPAAAIAPPRAHRCRRRDRLVNGQQKAEPKVCDRGPGSERRLL
jgi:hypothetical protein